MKTKVLVTGATGFIGANLVRGLLEKGNIDVFVTARETSNFWRLDDIKNKISKIYYLDLANRELVFQLIEDLQPNIVYHVATYGGFPNQKEKELIIKGNLNSTINILDACVEYGVDQFINTGSSSEYGIKEKPMREDDICEPISIYGITKLAATNYCTMIGKTLKYRVCTLRLFSPYGKYEESSRLYPSLVNALQEGKSPKLSKPDSVRDFIEIEEVIDIYQKIVTTNYQPGDIINVGSGKQQTIKEFYNKIRQKLNVDIDPIWGEAPQRFSEPQKWEADIYKLRSLIPK